MTLFPNPENMTTIYDIIIYGNSVSDGVLSTGILTSFYVSILLYMLSRNNTFADASTITGYLTTIITILFWALGLVNGWVLFVSITLFAFAALYHYYHND